ncbi:MAG TPA: hypothetical protein VNO18_24140 [Xanthobacteraceae bacterium]|nr:hypothetical protein [Xanthobacteraceae bacterium]
MVPDGHLFIFNDDRGAGGSRTATGSPKEAEPAAIASELLMRSAMRHAALGFVLIAVALGAQSVIAYADTPPKLNVGASCDAAASYAGLVGRDGAACMNDENDALDALKKNWSQYSSTDRTDCAGMVKTGGPPSYVELLSCLEMMKDVAAIHKSEPQMTTATQRQHD